MLFKSHPEVWELEEVRTFPTKALGWFELAEILPSLQIGRAVENCSLALRLSLLDCWDIRLLSLKSLERYLGYDGDPLWAGFMPEYLWEKLVHVMMIMVVTNMNVKLQRTKMPIWRMKMTATIVMITSKCCMIQIHDAVNGTRGGDDQMLWHEPLGPWSLSIPQV